MLSQFSVEPQRVDLANAAVHVGAPPWSGVAAEYSIKGADTWIWLADEAHLDERRPYREHLEEIQLWDVELKDVWRQGDYVVGKLHARAVARLRSTASGRQIDTPVQPPSAPSDRRTGAKQPNGSATLSSAEEAAWTNAGGFAAAVMNRTTAVVPADVNLAGCATRFIALLWAAYLCLLLVSATGYLYTIAAAIALRVAIAGIVIALTAAILRRVLGRDEFQAMLRTPTGTFLWAFWFWVAISVLSYPWHIVGILGLTALVGVGWSAVRRAARLGLRPLAEVRAGEELELDSAADERVVHGPVTHRGVTTPRQENGMATVEETLMKVQRIITGPMKLRAVVKENGFEVSFADISTVLQIYVEAWGSDQDGEPRSLVQLWAPVLMGVRPTPALYEWVARNGGSGHFGRIEVVDDSSDPGKVLLIYSHTLLGDYLDEPELRTAMWAVLLTADQWDDELQKQFGGRRWSDG